MRRVRLRGLVDLGSYQDQEVFGRGQGIRSLNGQWKTDLLQMIRQQGR